MIGIVPSTNLLLLPLPISSTINGEFGSGSGFRERRPPIFISSNPSHVTLGSLSNLYRSCNHSPHRFPSASTADFDTDKLAVAVSHSAVVVSVFAQIDGGEGLFGRILPAAGRVGPGNGDLVGFGRAISDLGLTATIFDVM